MAIAIPGTFTSGTFGPTAEPANALADVLRAGLESFVAASGGASWSVVQDLSAGPNRDFVFRSVGDPTLLDRLIYSRARRTAANTLTHEVHADWSTLSSSGRNTKSGSPAGLTTVAAITWYLFVNEVSYFMPIDNGGVWTHLYGGSSDRSHVPRSHQGIALSTGAVSAGVNVAIPVNADLRGRLRIGRSVDVIPMALLGGALPAPWNPERCVVVDVGPSTVTVATLVNNQPSNCLIGDDPLPIFTGALATPQLVLHRDFTNPGATGTGVRKWTNFTEVDIDPDALGVWRGCPLLWRFTGQGLRGDAFHIGLWGTNGSQAPTRRYRDDYNDRRVWAQFPALTADTLFIGGRTGLPTVPAFLPLDGSAIEGLSGTIAAGGVTKNVEMIGVLEGIMATRGWTQIQDQGAGGGDLLRHVWRSTGVGNSTHIDVRLRAQGGGTNIVIEVYLDWSTSTQLGRNLQSVTIGISNTAQHDWWIAINEYEITLIRRSGASWDNVTFGQTYRSHIRTRHRGRAFSTAPVNAGANVVIPVDRNLVGQLIVGDGIDVVPLSVGGGALPTFNKERTAVVAVDASSVTVAALANNQPAGCLIGDDPIPTMVYGSALGTFATFLYCLGRTGTTTTNVTNTFELNVAESELDPDIVGNWTGTRILVINATVGHRGAPRSFTAWPNNGVAVGDGFQDDETGQLFQCFPNVTASGWIMCLPFASVPGTVRRGQLFETLVDQRETPLDGPTVSGIYDDGTFHETLSALAPVPPSALRLLFITPINSNTMRVFLSREPRHFSPLATDDVLLRTNWTLELVAPLSDPRVFEPEIERVENPQPAADYLASIGINEPEAWSVDLRTARRLVASETFRVIISPNVRTIDGVGPDPDPDDRGEAPGRITFRGRRSLRPRAVREETVDLRYDTFVGAYVLDSRQDIDTHGGEDALKKRIIRRLISSPGGFRSLDGYGVGLRPKEKIDSTALAELRARVLEQVKLEDEVQRAAVDVAFSGGVLFVTVTVKTVQGSVRIGIESPEPGQFVVV